MTQEVWLGYLLDISESLKLKFNFTASLARELGQGIKKDTACGYTSDTESGARYNQQTLIQSKDK